MKTGAVAIDLGATSGRYAAGRLVEGRVEYEVIEQVPNRPIEEHNRVEWDAEAILELCRRACAYAKTNFDTATVGIDSWGVDHGFVDHGKLLHRPIAYRDLSHQALFEKMASHRERLYALTGIQHQPFNTIYQLAARDTDLDSLHGKNWLLMPDLMGFLLTGVAHCEYTMASTTQLMGLDDEWCPEAFEMIGWPVPELPIKRPGEFVGPLGDGFNLVSVGSHDTASAVFGLGPIADDQAFLNVGTWSLLGTVVDRPLLASPMFTNERTVDGRVRYLANIPGFYVVNRVYEELGLEQGIPEWLASADPAPDETSDLMAQEFFNPPSMCLALGHTTPPSTPEAWAALALGSLVDTTARQLADLALLTGRTFRQIRLAGGGSRSETFCQRLAARTGLTVVAGPEEATILGNLGMQYVASGDFASIPEAAEAIGRSILTRVYEP